MMDKIRLPECVNINPSNTSREAWALAIIDKLHQWLKKSYVLTKSKLGEAITYLNNQWSKLVRYLEDGQLSIDNNRAERAVKPFVIGRKNWLFSQTVNGAHANAALYSIIETAKANGFILLTTSFYVWMNFASKSLTLTVITLQY